MYKHGIFADIGEAVAVISLIIIINNSSFSDIQIDLMILVKKS